MFNYTDKIDPYEIKDSARYIQSDIEWIERFYADFEKGMRGVDKEYVRPADYKERALRVLHRSARPKVGFDSRKPHYEND